MPVELPLASQRRELPSLALFLATSVAIAVVAGFGLGWWLLLHETFGIPLPSGGWSALVQVHGHAMLLGAAGLLVMGISYRLLPRLRDAPAPDERLVLATYALMTAGVALRTAQLADPSAARTLSLLLSGALELAGTLLYASSTIRTLADGDNAHRTDELLMAAGAAWLAVAAMWNVASLDPLLRGAPLAAPGADAAVVAAVLVGVVGSHVLGVSVRVNSGFIAAQLVPDPVVIVATALWTVGTFFTAAGLAPGAPLLLAAAVALFLTVGVVGRSRAARPLPEHARVTMLAFRTGYAWLIVGLALLTLDALLPATSDALVVAGRHALAIGFLGSLAFGVGARLLPTLTGGTAIPLPAVRWATLLVNAAALLRVGGELLGASSPLASVALALSSPVGLLAVLAFAAGAVRTVRSMRHAFA